MEVLSSSPVSRRRPSMDELEKEQEFPTDDLSEEELAELGRVLLRVQGLEAKTRATREFLASRQKAGKDYWEGRVASKRNELSRDKKALAKGQARRASFFASKKVRFKI